MKAYLLKAVCLVAGALAIGAAVRLYNKHEQAQTVCQLKAAGQETVDELPSVKAYLAEALAANESLRKAFADAQAVAPGKVVYVSTSCTGPLEVGDEPRPEAPTPACPQPPPCVLAPGDTVEIDAGELQVVHAQGVDTAVGAGEVYRTLPLPRVRVTGGPFLAKLGHAAEVAAPSPALKGWGLGLSGLATAHGTAIGLALGTPELKMPLLGWAVEGVGTLNVGSVGFAASAAVLARP